MMSASSGILNRGVDETRSALGRMDQNNTGLCWAFASWHLIVMKSVLNHGKVLEHTVTPETVMDCGGKQKDSHFTHQLRLS